MNITVLIPHFKNYKVTAYSVSQFIKFKGNHEVEIIVIDNSFPDESIKGLEPFKNDITIIENKSTRISSHGIAYDMALIDGHVKTDYFVTAESDSFPENDRWIDYIEDLINQGYEGGGSNLFLSGGLYTHPAGAFHKKSNYFEAKEYCDKIEYTYFPNLCKSEGFDAHLMVHNSVLDRFLDAPDDYIEVSAGYKGKDKQYFLERADWYSPTRNPFHNGMGKNIESIRTYGQRNFETEVPNVLLDNKRKLIKRIGFEPGQFFSYFNIAVGKKIAYIPTEVFWLKNREGQQQEKTVMQNGFTHIWAGSSFLDMEGTDYHDVYEFKKNQIHELYNSLPQNYKVQL